MLVIGTLEDTRRPRYSMTMLSAGIGSSAYSPAFGGLGFGLGVWAWGWLRVEGLGLLGVWGSGFRVQGLRFGVWGLGLRV